MGDMENEVLPDGWRVEMRVRKNGRKDKVYIEKVEAEGLPPGWIKEIRVTKTANKVRKDPVYIDPVSGYFFRSMRDASRYLETGKIGRLAYKPKDKGSNDGGHDEELENDKCDSPTVAKKQKLEVPGAETPVVDQSTMSPTVAKKQKLEVPGAETPVVDQSTTSPTVAKKQKLETPGTKTPVVDWSTKASDIAENEDALNSAGTGEQTENEDALNSDSTGERICLTERASNQNGAGIVLSSSNVPEAKDSNKMDGEKDSDKSASLSTPAVEVLPDRKSSEGGDTRDENKNTGPGKCGSRKKKVLNLPRRASKRLAGVALDPTPELKPITRGRRAVDKQSDEMVAPTVEGLAPQVSQQPNELKDEPESNHASDTTKSSDDSLKSGKSWHLTQNSNEHAEKTETDYNSDKKLGCDVVLPQTNQDKAETDSKADVKPGPLLDLPFGELLSDPCIAFAIKTLTGGTFDTSNTTEVSLGSNNSIFEGFSTSEEHSGKIKTETEGVEKQNNLAIPKEQAVKVKSSYETDENPGLPLDLPFADIWRDPCIEFAIKTLTSSNPVGCDLDIQDYFQQQHNTSQTQASNNFCQTEFLCQQYDVLEKQVSREQGRNGNVRIQSSGEKGLRQHGEKRCNECH